MKSIIEKIIEFLKSLIKDEPPLKDSPVDVEPVKDGTIPAYDPNSPYIKLFKSAKINRSKSWIKSYAKKIYKDKHRYKGVADHIGCPWWIVALIHTMEASRDFSKNLHNGQPWNKKTTLVPKGRGPFKSWEEAAIDALRYDKADKVKSWSLDNALEFLEGYNGFGYRKRKINSPYLWAFTNHWTKGKFVRDGVFDPNADTKQAGICSYLLAMIEMKYELEGITGQFDYGDRPVPVDPKQDKKSVREMMWNVAHGELGVKEVPGKRANKRIIEYHKTTGGWSSDEIAWCASFCNWLCKQLPGVKGTGKANARSFMKWGRSTSSPKRGDVVVFWRGSRSGWKGHVALFSHIKGDKVYVLGGNQGNRVSIAPYNINRVLSYRTAV